MNKLKRSAVVLFLLLFAVLQTSAQNSPHKKKSVWARHIQVYTTAANTDLRLAGSDSLAFKAGRQPIETEISVIVNPSKSFQTCLGIGGAITDASAEVFAKLSATKQQEFVDAYYSNSKGIGYTLARTNIHSCDFSSGSYTYIAEGDKELKTFNVSHDEQFRIPLIKRAMQAAGGKLLLFASPWSPPAFMKDNDNMLQGGKLLPEYDQAWANYFVKFIEAYQKHGINVWGVTVQNEPLAKQRWESCKYTAEEERDFVKYYLGPTFQKDGLADKKIIIWDHNRDLMGKFSDVILSDPDAAKYVWGVGFHWYETWTGGQPMYNNVGSVHQSYPAKSVLLTEACVERFDAGKFNFWPNAERYGSAIINDFNNGAVGWTDWNILLDEKGGPNHVGNFCFAPVHANTQTGELIYTPSYYYLGHFSKFIRPGAKRISTVSSRSSLLSTSFINPDGKIATVVMNQTDDAIPYRLCIQSKVAEETIPAHAIQTMVY